MYGTISPTGPACSWRARGNFTAMPADDQLDVEGMLGRFRERYGTGAKSGAVGRWIGRQIFERALLHGPTAPRVLAAMMRAALRLNPALAADPRVAKALFLHLVVYRRRARR